MQTPPKMAAGPTGPTAVSSNRTHPITPRRVRSYVRSGVLLGGRKADCGERSFERCHPSARAIALFERRSSTRTITPLLRRPFSRREFWARLISRYEPTYRSGLLALVSGFVPTSWDQNAVSRKCWFTVESAGDLPFPPRCKPIPQNQ